jgi:hypothetical protein
MPITSVFTSGTQDDSVSSVELARITYDLLGSAAPGQLGPTSQPIFVADNSYSIVAAYYRPEIAGSTTIMLVHAVSSTPVNSAIPVMQSTFNLSGTVDLTQTALLVSGSSITQVAIGDAIGIRPTTAGAATGTGTLTLVMQRI